MEAIKKLAIHVRSALTNDFEVVLEADGENILDLIQPNMMGLNPNGILTEPCPLEPREYPEVETIGRCCCGEIGCGRVDVEILRDGETVVWRAWGDPTAEIRFAIDQYKSELTRALHDFSWETIDRTAARMIANSIDADAILRHGLRFDWASATKPGMMTVSLRGGGYHQVLISLPWGGDDIDELVRRFQSTLSSPPDSWPNVEEFNRPSTNPGGC